MRRLLCVLLVVMVVVAVASCSGGASAGGKLTPSAVIAAFQAAGLEAEEARPMAKPKDYGPAPLVAVEGVRFLIPSMGEGNGGRVFSFANEKDRDTMKAHYDGLGKASGWFFSWTYAHKLILVQINGQLPEATARKYEAVLLGMK